MNSEAEQYSSITPNKTIKDKLWNLIMSKDKYLNSKGDILLGLVVDDINNENEELINLLSSDEKLRNIFFRKINDISVFRKKELISIVNSYEFMTNSYTKFCERIGLVDRKNAFLSDSNDVVLSFPYKDCYLEGGQTKEDQKYTEVFYNEVLAKDEVERLLAPKVFSNVVKYQKDENNNLQKENPTTFNIEKDNLLIKGNNLVALSSILERYEGKIKCIYIDPPYNTGGDSFKYNDNFNHSTWLTFMRNRISKAYELLRKDGCLFVQIDYHELGYLIPLLDEIFGKSNLVQIISVKTSSPAGFKTVNPGPIDVTEYILFYAKDRNSFNFKKLYVPTVYDSNYDLYIKNPNENPENWILEKLYNVIYRQNGIEIGDTWQKSNKNAEAKWGEYWKIIRDSLIAEFALKNSDRIVSIRDPQKPTQELKILMEKSKIERNKIFVYKKSEDDKQGFIINGGALSFYSKKIKEIDGVLTPTELLTDLWQDISWDGIANEGAVKLKNGKKPEKLLRRIIDLSTDEGDIVLDFHVGSGTTCAVAHKLNRKYIGIEQLNYENNDSLVRLCNVIRGDDSGISKVINWQGGGSFIYCELAEDENYKYLEKISNAKEGNIDELKQEIINNAIVRYEIEDKKINDYWNVSNLSLENKKDILKQLIDKNYMYINYTEMEDSKYKYISETDKAFTKSFYEGV